MEPVPYHITDDDIDEVRVDLLIRDGYIELTADEARVFPPSAGRDTERSD